MECDVFEKVFSLIDNEEKIGGAVLFFLGMVLS